MPQDRVPRRGYGLSENQRLENDVARARAIAAAKYSHRRRQPRVVLTLGGVIGVAVVTVIAGMILVPLALLGIWKAAPYLALFSVCAAWRYVPPFRYRIVAVTGAYSDWRIRQTRLMQYALIAVTAVLFALLAWWVFWNLLWIAITAVVVWLGLRMTGRRHALPILHEPAPEIEPDRGRVVAAVAAGLGSRARTYLDAFDRMGLPAPVPGWGEGSHTLTVRLPDGVVPSDLDAERFAHAYDVKVGRVRVDGGKPGHVVIEVLDTDPSNMTAPMCPWLGSSTCITEPFQLGITPTSAPYMVSLADPMSGATHALVVGMKGSGKSWLMRLFALYTATDPDVSVWLIDCGGGREWDAFEGRTDYTWVGRPDTSVVAQLESAVALMDRRADERYDPRSGDWLWIIIDEVHMLWDVTGGEAAVAHIVRVGRKFGVGVVLGTQLPNKESVPTAIEMNCDVRVLMRASGSWAPQMVHSGSKLEATSLRKGQGYMVTPDEPVPTLVTTPPVNGDDAARHLVHAPMRTPPPQVPTPPAPKQEDTLTLQRILDAIGQRKGVQTADVPEFADGLGVTVTALQSFLKTNGVLHSATWTENTVSYRGIVRLHVEKAIKKSTDGKAGS